MNHKEIGNKLCEWAIKVYNDIDSGFYPEALSGFQVGIFINKIETAKTESEFWKAFNNTLGKILTIIDDEPASDEGKKKDRISLDILLPILTEASQKRPQMAEVITLVQGEFPEIKEIYTALNNQIGQN